MYAVKQAVEIAQQFEAQLILLHVIHNQKNKYPLFFLDDEKIEDLEEKIDTHAQKQLDEICEKHINPSGVQARTKIRHGVSYDEIVREEKESKADLIVISSRGESRLVEFFYGSTTEKVARRASLFGAGSKKQKTQV